MERWSTCTGTYGVSFLLLYLYSDVNSLNSPTEIKPALKIIEIFG